MESSAKRGVQGRAVGRRGITMISVLAGVLVLMLIGVSVHGFASFHNSAERMRMSDVRATAPAGDASAQVAQSGAGRARIRRATPATQAGAAGDTSSVTGEVELGLVPARPERR